MKNIAMVVDARQGLTTSKRKNATIIGLFLLSVILLFSCSKSSSNNSNPPVVANTVNIANMSFGPAAITVMAGATVTWNNNDNMAHTVTADDNSFDSGSIPMGGHFSKTFSATGSYSYHCTIHPTMTGTVTVVTK
ncbi:MAG: cupredoxin domain-containing protein [Bacteroidota bacterium]|nr:cupredoxin domain-containing protein [Bacteroidota bacterium]